MKTITHYLKGTSPWGNDILIAFTTLEDSTQVFVQPYSYAAYEYKNTSISWCDDVLGTSLQMNNVLSKGLARDFWNALVDNKGFVQGEPIAVAGFDHPPTHHELTKANQNPSQDYLPREDVEAYKKTVRAYLDEISRSRTYSQSYTNYALEA